ncbi:MAG: hypothetical protein ACRC8Z_03940 [Empedobacter falsenii]
MKTAVEWLIDELTDDPSKFLFLCDKPEYMDELIKIVKTAKEMEHKQIEQAIENGYAGCCGKKTTVKLKSNFWERKESWDEKNNVNKVIVDVKNKPEMKVRCLHCGRYYFKDKSDGKNI